MPQWAAVAPDGSAPSRSMFRAAFSSRSSIKPQLVQTWVGTDRLVYIRSPQPLQSCVVYAEGIASTRLPAHAALQARIRRKACHPASLLLWLRPALRLAPLCS